MRSQDWKSGATHVSAPFEMGECGGENCSKFIEWNDKLFNQVGEHTARDAGHLKADQCAVINGCIFEQAVEVEGVQNAS